MFYQYVVFTFWSRKFDRFNSGYGLLTLKYMHRSPENTWVRLHVKMETRNNRIKSISNGFIKAIYLSVQMAKLASQSLHGHSPVFPL